MDQPAGRGASCLSSLGVGVERAAGKTAVEQQRQLAGGAHSAFVSGNDSDAKKAATALLESFGHKDVIDLGDITTARGAEMLLPIWLRLWGALGTSLFNFKIVR